eukprot:gene9517-6820_t
MSSKGEYYAAKSDMDDLDTIGDKLAQDLRKSIRTLDHYPILSDPWIEMAEIFGRVAHISTVESSLPSSKQDATLWETEEQALRFLLEDGKLNLCVRILIEFKVAQIESRRDNRGPMIDYFRECDKFEKGLGVILRNAWQHVEVQQTTDVHAVVEHIGGVLAANLQQSALVHDLLRNNDIYQRQEMLVFQYLHDLLKNVEEIRESRLMPIVRENRIFMKTIRNLTEFGTEIIPKHKLLVATALAYLVDTEDFLTHRDQYIIGREDIEDLVRCKEQVLQGLMTDLEKKKLTDMGARQLMELGQRLRQNYQNHPAVVPPSLAEAASQMYCRSTNFCRTHQSLRGLLAGLFLDLSRPAEAQESPIRPVITARPRKQETLYPQADANCVAMLRRRGQIFSEDVLRRAVPAYTTLKSKMQRVFRFPDGKINWLHIKEVLLCHDVHNIEPSIPLRKYVKTPENGISLSEEELVASGDVATMTWSILYNDDTLNRMAIGRFLHELLSDMSDSDSNPLKDKTMLMYSGHDSTLVPVLCALKCFDDKWPEYGSSIQFEIVEEKGSQGKFVRVIYNDRVMYPWGSTDAWLPLETFERRLGALRLSESDYTRCCEGEDLSQFAPLQSEEEQARLKEIREDIERETKATTSGN